MRRHGLAIGMVAMLAVVACSSGGDTQPSSTADFDEMAGVLVSDALLSKGDLPAGWDEVADGAGFTATAELSPGCDVFDLDVTFDGAAATDASETYQGLRDQQVTTFAAVYQDAVGAAAAVDATRGTFDRCDGEFRDVVRDLAEDRLEALGIDLGFLADIDVDLEELDVDLSVDTHAAYRVGVKVGIVGADQRFTLDVLVFSEGRVAAAMTYATFGSPDEQEEAEIAGLLLDNSAAVEAQLPPSGQRSVARR